MAYPAAVGSSSAPYGVHSHTPYPPLPQLGYFYLLPPAKATASGTSGIQRCRSLRDMGIYRLLLLGEMVIGRYLRLVGILVSPDTDIHQCNNRPRRTILERGWELELGWWEEIDLTGGLGRPVAWPQLFGRSPLVAWSTSRIPLFWHNPWVTRPVTLVPLF